MKSSRNNMAFRVGSYFLVFIGSMLIMLWMFQITFLEPFYRVNQTKNIQRVASEVEIMMNSKMDVDTSSVFRVLFSRENMCGSIYDDHGNNVMSIAVELIGPNCYLPQISDATMLDYVNTIRLSSNKEINIPFRTDTFDQSMSFYGRSFRVDEADFYIFINTPTELLDSTVEVLKNQFLMVSVLVLLLGTITALLLARRLADPIYQMNATAKRLAEGDYSVEFKGDGYQEAIELSQTLNFATSEFSKTDELRRDLVANVSHDIKTPLTMIKAYAEMIEDISGEDPVLRSEHLKIIIDETNHLEKFVNDMLSLSQYESGVISINETRFNLKDHIESTINLFQVDKAAVEVKVDRSLFVMADEIKMGQVLYNYINNAIKHSNGKGPIKIEVKASRNEVEVSVIDNGVGISEADQKVIWDRYTQINKHHARKVSSSGLGLSIVAAICEATKSKYGVESKEGKGSRFFYTLNRVK